MKFAFRVSMLDCERKLTQYESCHFQTLYDDLAAGRQFREPNVQTSPESFLARIKKFKS
jgi:hypothetical protein